MCILSIHLSYWAYTRIPKGTWSSFTSWVSVLARYITCKCFGLLGDAPLDLTDDCSLALVWKNNERMKEFVLVESKELECVEDPGSASEAARAGHFTLEQCLNLFTKPEVLAPEEAW